MSHVIISPSKQEADLAELQLMEDMRVRSQNFEPFIVQDDCVKVVLHPERVAA